jgi:hypothetical protein
MVQIVAAGSLPVQPEIPRSRGQAAACGGLPPVQPPASGSTRAWHAIQSASPRCHDRLIRIDY